GFLKYYISNYMTGYYGDAKLVGFVQDDETENFLDFTEQSGYENYGATMIVSSLYLNTRVGDEYSYSALSKDPVVQSGNYSISDNTISGMAPVVLEYHLGEGNNIKSISIESINMDESGAKDKIGSIRAFRGSLSFYNKQTGGFDVMDIGDGVLNRTELTAYLGEDNVLAVKYTPAEQNAGIDERRYLPMITVTVKENVAVINQILESDGVQDAARESAGSGEVGPYSADSYGTVVVEETAPSIGNTPEETVTEESEAADDIS
ncbi:hypothetical protein UYO_2886, partial [Lachnospiraceae bacterium JC7]